MAIYFRDNANAYSSLNKTRFSGLGATRAAQDNHLSRKKMLAAVNDDIAHGDTPYVGNFPDEIQSNKTELLNALDEAAKTVQSNSFQKDTYTLSNGTQIHKLGAGAYGTTYRIEINGKPYAFKVFISEQTQDIFDKLSMTIDHLFNGALPETAAGLFLTHQKTKDLAKFYISNPMIGWQLSEFVDQSTNLSNREGETISDQGYLCIDDCYSGNRINGIRVDFGDIVKNSIGARLMAAKEEGFEPKDILKRLIPGWLSALFEKEANAS